MNSQKAIETYEDDADSEADFGFLDGAPVEDLGDLPIAPAARMLGPVSLPDSLPSVKEFSVLPEALHFPHMPAVGPG
jgi:hypothetical protein